MIGLPLDKREQRQFYIFLDGDWLDRIFKPRAIKMQ